MDASILYFISVVVLQGVSGCDYAAVVQCLDLFPFDMDKINVYSSEQTLRDHCNSRVRPYVKCVKGQIDDCDSDLPMIKLFNGLNHAVEYDCGDGREGAVRFGACVEGGDAVEAITECGIKWLFEVLAKKDDDEESCELTRSLLDCARDGVVEKCGADSGSWVDKNFALAFGPAMEEAGCGCSGLTATLSLLAAAVFLQWFVR